MIYLDTTLKVGPADIVDTLSSFGKHQFFPRRAALNADYDLLYLGNDQILLTVHGQVVDPRSDEEDAKVAVDQSFVLCSYVLALSTMTLCADFSQQRGSFGSVAVGGYFSSDGIARPGLASGVSVETGVDVMLVDVEHT